MEGATEGQMSRPTPNTRSLLAQPTVRNYGSCWTKYLIKYTRDTTQYLLLATTKLVFNWVPLL